jgi:hypothetical protein
MATGGFGVGRAQQHRVLGNQTLTRRVGYLARYLLAVCGGLAPGRADAH